MCLADGGRQGSHPHPQGSGTDQSWAKRSGQIGPAASLPPAAPPVLPSLGVGGRIAGELQQGPLLFRNAGPGGVR